MDFLNWVLTHTFVWPRGQQWLELLVLVLCALHMKYMNRRYEWFTSVNAQTVAYQLPLVIAASYFLSTSVQAEGAFLYIISLYAREIWQRHHSLRVTLYTLGGALALLIAITIL